MFHAKFLFITLALLPSVHAHADSNVECYSRSYSNQDLQRHPKQQTQSISALITKSGSEKKVALGVTLRDPNNFLYSQELLCSNANTCVALGHFGTIQIKYLPGNKLKIKNIDGIALFNADDELVTSLSPDSGADDSFLLSASDSACF